MRTLEAFAIVAFWFLCFGILSHVMAWSLYVLDGYAVFQVSALVAWPLLIGALAFIGAVFITHLASK